jgi:arabinofuranan 3-O-arabinosyltransferase
VRIIVAQEPGPTITAGIRELRIPGVHATEALRPPVIAERALRGTAPALTYVFQRTTGDDPFRRDPWHGASSSALVRDRGDAERGLERVFSPPNRSTWDVDGWATVAPAAPDSAIDALVGLRGRFDSSARFEGRPGFRASSAFDRTAKPWIGSSQRRLTLDPVPGVRRPTRVRVGAATIDVGADGVVRLPRPVRGRVRMEILRAAFAPGTPGRQRQRQAVGIAEIHGGPSVEVPRSGGFASDCDAFALTVGEADVGVGVLGTYADLDAGRPLRIGECAAFDLPAGRTRLSARAGTFTPYVLRLRTGGSAPAPAPGRVVSAGTATRGGRKDVRLALTGPARLVLAESYTRGRRATCDGNDLGVPEVGDAFGTAWRVPASCKRVTIAFAPNRLVNAGYGISAVVAALLLVLLVAGRRRLEVSRSRPAWPDETDSPGMSVRRAALIALPVGLAFGFVFAARAVPLFALGTFAILWRGAGAKHLALAGGAVLGIAVPVLTIVIRPEDRGGYNPEYSIDRVAVHWVAVAGVALFILALSRAMGRPAPAPAAPPTSDAPPRPAP